MLASSERGFLPKGVTTNPDRVTNLWNGSWIAALGVGVLVWGLIIWCVVAYRRSKDDDGLPEQLRYNLPIEILYTVVPLFMIGVLFFYTARDETALLDVSHEPRHTVNVVGKQWALGLQLRRRKTSTSPAPWPSSPATRCREDRFRPCTCRSTSRVSSC